MKLPILILAFIVAATTMHAQNPRITSGNPRTETYTYFKGGDSVRFTILGKNDTTQIAKFYRNGRTSRLIWKKDSIYLFNALGYLYKIFYDVNEFGESRDNVRIFYPNGQVRQLRSFKNRERLEQFYAQNGELLWSEHIVYAPKRVKHHVMGKNNVPIRSYRIDTLINGKDISSNYYDTLYYANGKPFKIDVFTDKHEQLGGQYFNPDGSLNKTILPDSLRLTVFKDNVACYYGLKNKRGDTIVKPRFDRIELFENTFWQAFTGESCILLDLNGAPMSIPFARLSSIAQMNRTIPFQKGDNRFSRRYFEQEHIDSNALQTYYAFTADDKHSVATLKGDIILPPQYLTLSNRYLGNLDYFSFYNRQEDTLLSIGYVNRQGKQLFSDAFKSVIYTYFKDYFFLSKRPFFRQSGCGAEEGWRYSRRIEGNYLFDNEKQYVFGLGQADDNVLLEPKFSMIQHIDSNLFLVAIVKFIEKTKRFETVHGLIDVQLKQWLLDTTIFTVETDYDSDNACFMVQNNETNKYGIMNKAGKFILPIVYDSIGIIKNNTGLFCLKKEGRYQIATQNKDKIDIRKTLYDYLSLVKYTIEEDETVNYFLAKRRNKWGVIDANEKIIKPFDYDYASGANNREGNFLLVKNNQAASYDLTSLPNETGDFSFPTFPKPSKEEVKDFSLADNSSQVFFINESGKVIIPPQYKYLGGSGSGDYRAVENAKKQKKVIFLKTGQIVDFPFNYTIKWAHPKGRVMIVKDSTEASYGVVSTDGKLLVPCNNYGVAIGDIKASVFFVKRDTPLIIRPTDVVWRNADPLRFSSDSFNIEDQNWLMYDSLGRLLSDKPFRFPIRFEDGLGVGVKGDTFNLYKTDGSIMSLNGVQDFRNAQSKYERDGGYCTFFYNQGITPTIILAKMNGEIIIDKGRYDGISQFYYQYALVSKAGKIGLVDTLGREIIPPQYLQDFKADFIDSLDTYKQYHRDKQNNKKHFYYRHKQDPIDFNYSNKHKHPDSLDLTAFQKSALWNLMLQKSVKGIVQTASDLEIPRVKMRETARFLSFYSKSESGIYSQPHRIEVTNNTIAFALKHYGPYYWGYLEFYNFYQRNNRWEELQINDLLNIQGEKRWAMNDLMTKKIKALKDQEIDCSNTSAFITTVENRFMLTKEGVDFCFDSTKYSSDFVVISFTWAELSPFLKMKL